MAKFHTLTDNFNDNSLDAAKWKIGPLQHLPVETNQRFELTIPAGSSNAGFETVNNYDIIASYVQFEMYNYSEYFEVLLYNATNEFFINMYIDSGTINFFIFTDITTLYTMSTIAYNATTHRWLRFSEASGIIYFDTSPDAVVWTTRGQHTYTITKTDIIAQIYSANPSGTARTTYLDNFNILTSQTTRTQTGISRVTAVTSSIQTGKAAVKVTTTKTQTGIARVTVTTTRTQTGVAMVGLITTCTQTGKSRVTKVVSRTQTGVSTISALVSRTQTGKAFIGSDRHKFQTGTSRIVFGVDTLPAMSPAAEDRRSYVRASVNEKPRVD